MDYFFGKKRSPHVSQLVLNCSLESSVAPRKRRLRPAFDYRAANQGRCVPGLPLTRCSARARLSPLICHPLPSLLIRQEPRRQGGPREGSEELAGREKRSPHKKHSKRSKYDDDEPKGDTTLTENNSTQKKKTNIHHVKIKQKPMENDSYDSTHR